jgi:predicted glycoside hydrolase/deacetylase ChbG (UPF0249 family)
MVKTDGRADQEPERFQVVFNADDFGLDEGINAGIVQSYKNGVVRSASLTACGAAFEDAVARARNCRNLGLGAHLTLTEEIPLAGRSVIEGRDLEHGRFTALGPLARAAFRGRLDMAAVEREWRAQIERVIAAGARPTHLDGHQWTHLLPGLFPLCLLLAREYNIPRLRTLPDDHFGRGDNPRRFLELRILAWNSRRHVLPHLPPGMRPYPTLGFLRAGGKLTAEYLGRRLSDLKDQPLVEVMLHPGRPDTDTRTRYGHWGYDWENDARLAQDMVLARLLLTLRARIVSFGECEP